MAFVFVLLIGAAAAFFLSQSSQDVRNQASVEDGAIEITAKSSEQIIAGKPAKIDLFVNSNSANMDALQLEGNFTGVDVSDITVQVANAERTNLKAQVNKVNDDGTIQLVFTLNNSKKAFSASQPTQIATISFVPQSEGDLSLTWNPGTSKATLFRQTEDQLKTPVAFSGRVLGSDDIVSIQKPAGSNCVQDSQCAPGLVCYQPPMPECPEGMACAQVMPAKICAEVIDGEVQPLPTPIAMVDPIENPRMTPTPTPTPSPIVSENPVTPGDPTPSPTAAPTPTPAPGSEGQYCSVNADCQPGLFCYQPPMPECPDGLACAQVMPAQICALTGSVSPTPQPTPPSTTISDNSIRLRPTPPVGLVPTNPDGSIPVATTRPIPMITQNTPTCEYTYTQWSACKSGIQTRKATANSNYCLGTPEPVVQSCVSETPEPPFRANYDANRDRKVNTIDLSYIRRRLLTTDAQADINQDGTVDIIDYALVLNRLRK
ncbi:dockerin type I repeat-containing protein [Candidatus Woesebacteria bacterium]|nr:dockerin type I repeat-containing protein [Candidatus Woesebacteria bacterium]MCD8506978.1 dockerin type I repeat-containing protein [Candidatus Woesebacteria bacterium]